MSGLLEPLRHVAIIASAAAVIVSPVAGILLCVLVERRPFRLREQYLAFAIGDIGLAVGIGAGAHVLDGATPRIPALLPVALVVVGLVVGVVQGIHDVTSGRYTRGQVMSPTKLWHQLVVLPMALCWVPVSVIAIVLARNWLALTIWTGGIVMWLALMIYDRFHPKAAHVEAFWWSREPTRVSGNEVMPTTAQARASRSGVGGHVASNRTTEAAAISDTTMANSSASVTRPTAQNNRAETTTPDPPSATSVE
jgi:hypothetical protein